MGGGQGSQGPIPWSFQLPLRARFLGWDTISPDPQVHGFQESGSWFLEISWSLKLPVLVWNVWCSQAHPALPAARPAPPSAPTPSTSRPGHPLSPQPVLHLAPILCPRLYFNPWELSWGLCSLGA